MKQEFYNLQINTNGQKLYEFTQDTINGLIKIILRMECLI
jgi:hypothetical protein